MLQTMKIREEFTAIRKNSYAIDALDFTPDSLDCTEGVNPFGCPQSVLDYVLKKEVDEAMILNYPHNQQVFEVIQSYWEKQACLAKDNILLTDGSIAAIYVVNHIFAKKGAKVLGISPQFSDYVSHARLSGMEYSSVPLERDEGYAFCVGRFLDSITEELSLIYLDNPNNPTGQLISADNIELILKKAKEKGVYVIVDEAYGDFVGRSNSAMQFVNRYDNLIVLRTFSKGFGMAGIRAGYIIASEELISFMNQISNPYAVSELGRKMVTAALRGENWLDLHVMWFAQAKKTVRSYIGKNLLMSETDDRVPIFLLYHKNKEVNLVQALANYGMRAVEGSAFESIDNHCARVRLPHKKDFDRFLNILGMCDCERR